MSQSTLLIMAAFLIIGLVPLVPKMIELRTMVLRWLRLRRFADWHERHARPLTLVVRVIFAAFGIVLLVAGLTGA